MKLHKIFLLAAVALATAFTSCSDDDSYNAGAQAGDYNVGFASEEKKALALTDNSFDITISREDPDGQLTVPIQEVINTAGFTVPSSVTFADGATEATITVGIPSDMKVCTEYDLSIKIPESYTNPYKQGAYSPECKIVVVKEDYKHYADATFTDGFWGYDPFDVEVEYSETMGMYRIQDLFEVGYPLYFSYSEDQTEVNILASDGSVPTSWYTGLADDYYPSYYVTVAKSECTYDKDTKTITFDFWWRVSAGSYGTGYPCYLEFK